MTATKTKEKSIRLRDWEVRAILAGTKTRLSVPVKPQPVQAKTGEWIIPSGSQARPDDAALDPPYGWGQGVWEYFCPLGKVGNRVLVKETWSYFQDEDNLLNCIRYRADGAKRKPKFHDFPEVSNNTWFHFEMMCDGAGCFDHSWQPSTTMPRWASRITLEIESVSVARVQDTDHRGCVAEGWPGQAQLLDPSDTDSHFAGATKGDWICAIGDGDDACIEWFADMWDARYGNGAWERNDWAWIYQFRRLEQ